MPRDEPSAAPVDTPDLERSLDRYLTVGLVFMALLLAGFAGYRVREPHARAEALRAQQTEYTKVGARSFATLCASCHGKGANGGSAPTLNAKEFLAATTDAQMHDVISAGIPGSDMPTWSIDLGGTLTDQQITQLIAYLRSLQKTAPSVPDWRQGKG